MRVVCWKPNDEQPLCSQGAGVRRAHAQGVDFSLSRVGQLGTPNPACANASRPGVGNKGTAIPKFAEEEPRPQLQCRSGCGGEDPFVLEKRMIGVHLHSMELVELQTFEARCARDSGRGPSMNHLAHQIVKSCHTPDLGCVALIASLR